MNEIEKMKRYIERTKMGNAMTYQMSIPEMLNLAHSAAEVPTEIVCLAFNYGRAKGYRAAKAEVKRA